jgi:hypothetical protein
MAKEPAESTARTAVVVNINAVAKATVRNFMDRSLA